MRRWPESSSRSRSAFAKGPRPRGNRESRRPVPLWPEVSRRERAGLRVYEPQGPSTRQKRRRRLRRAREKLKQDGGRVRRGDGCTAAGAQCAARIGGQLRPKGLKSNRGSDRRFGRLSADSRGSIRWAPAHVASTFTCHFSWSRGRLLRSEAENLAASDRRLPRRVANRSGRRQPRGRPCACVRIPGTIATDPGRDAIDTRQTCGLDGSTRSLRSEAGVGRIHRSGGPVGRPLGVIEPPDSSTTAVPGRPSFRSYRARRWFGVRKPDRGVNRAPHTAQMTREN